MRLHTLPLTFLLLGATALADEPGLEQHGADEPAESITTKIKMTSPGRSSPRARLELGFGYASLLEDPDVGDGYGGGIFFSYELAGRIGAELSVFVSNNPFEAELGSIGASFLAGNITLGPTVRLTPKGGRFIVTADLALGTYLIVPLVQDKIWTLGLSGGMTLAYRFVSWFGLSLKVRYHLFNLANISGPELRDLKALTKVGVIDRMEFPVCLTFFF